MLSNFKWGLVLVVVAWRASGCSVIGQADMPRAAYIPRGIGEAGWLRKVGDQQMLLTNRRCRVCFIGDSLTEFWQSTGEAAWRAIEKDYAALNLGVAGDRTEHILNRISRLDFQRANPEMFVLMMGTNNFGMEPSDAPEDVVRAIEKAVGLLMKKVPRAKVVLLEIPPSGYEADSKLRQNIQAANRALAEKSWPSQVTVVECYKSMTGESGFWKPELTLDGTHFSPKGYDVLASILVPILQEKLSSVSNTQ